MNAAGLRDRVLAVCRTRGWSMAWQIRMAHVVLELSELVEAIRGKQGDSRKESADMLFTLIALSPHDLPEIVEELERKIDHLMVAGPYAGESAFRVDYEGSP